jgi:hypothetical protein
MKTKKMLRSILSVVFASPLIAAGGGANCNFDGYSNGQICNQYEWSILRGSPAGFTIEPGAGTTAHTWDKALKIEFETEHSTILAPLVSTWTPGYTWTLELDFRLELASSNRAEDTHLIFGLLMGGPELKDRCRWLEMLGIQPDGKWNWVGGAPNWKQNRDLPPGLFMARPASGSDVSDWYHLRFTSKKLDRNNSFESVMTVTRSHDGKEILQHVYNNAPDSSAMAVKTWGQKTMRFGFCQGGSSPGGCVWIDNIQVTSEPEKATPMVVEKADPNRHAKVYCKKNFGRFKVGENATLDDWEAISFAEVPEAFEGFKVSMNYFKENKPCYYKVKEPGQVYIVAFKAVARQMGYDGWKFVAEAITVNANGQRRAMYIMKKYHEVGEYTLLNEGAFGTRILKK